MRALIRSDRLSEYPAAQNQTHAVVPAHAQTTDDLGKSSKELLRKLQMSKKKVGNFGQPFKVCMNQKLFILVL